MYNHLSAKLYDAKIQSFYLIGDNGVEIGVGRNIPLEFNAVSCCVGHSYFRSVRFSCKQWIRVKYFPFQANFLDIRNY